MSTRPTPPAPRGPAPAAPRPPARPAPRLLEAIGAALGTVRAELRKEHAEALDAMKAEHRHQLAELEGRLRKLEAARRRPPKALNVSNLIGRGRAA